MSELAAYFNTQPQRELDEVLRQHALLVKRIAFHLKGRLPLGVGLDDLIQVGMIGLMEAWQHFDPAQGASFETYAGIRIRGAMLDEVRRNNWAPRSIQRRSRDLMQAIAELEQRLNREANDAEIAQHLGLALEEYHRLLQDIQGQRLLSLDDETVAGRDGDGYPLPDSEPGPEHYFTQRDRQAAVSAAIHSLSERDQLVLSLYYAEEMNLREIGAVLGVSESRVCQIHTQALLRLRSRLETCDV